MDENTAAGDTTENGRDLTMSDYWAASPEARAKYPHPGTHGRSLETVRQLRTLFDARNSATPATEKGNDHD